MTMNYDPNMTVGGRMAKQTVRLTFGVWDARLTVEEVVGGNCTGLSVIETALENYYERLPGGDYPSITLLKPDGDTLLVSDDMDEREDWLKGMLVGAEIVAIKAGGRWTSKGKLPVAALSPAGEQENAK